MKEIRLHGRGGQGVLMAAEVIAAAAIRGGKYAACFPLFTAERRGAPVTAFARIDGHAIQEKTQIYHPDCLIILDPNQGTWPQSYQGLKEDGVLIINAPEKVTQRPHQNIGLIGTVDATRIALEELGIPAFNTCMMGAFSAATGWVKLDDIVFSLEKFFNGESLRRNIKCVERGYNEAVVVEFEVGVVYQGAVVQTTGPPKAVEYESAWTMPGVIRDLKMGGWRYFRPVRKDDKCCRCGWCLLLCPTGCIFYNHGAYVPKLDYCKGCGICAEECPVNAITMQREGLKK